MTAVPDLTDPLWSPTRRGRLVRLCATLVRDAAVAEDLAQETLLQAWRLQDRLTDPTGIDAWLDAIARNVCRRWLRARGRAALPTGDTEALAEVAGAGNAHDLDAVLEREELVELLERALALLPADTREALVGHYVEELSHSEIAQRIGSSPGAVSMRVSRGRVRLRHLLETTFAEDALAEGWARRAEAGWRPTRQQCSDCGRATVQLRHTREEVAFRCLTCDPDGLSVHLDLGAPALRDLVGSVRRPSAIEGRLADWSSSYWRVHDPATMRCVRCDGPVRALTYSRDDVRRWCHRRGWYATCHACGQQVCTSVAGQVLSLPEVRAARRQGRRLRLLPERDVTRDGADATVVAVGGVDGTPLASAVFLRESLRLVHVDGPAAP